jgi:hypothetical protein
VIRGIPFDSFRIRQRLRISSWRAIYEGTKLAAIALNVSI